MADMHLHCKHCGYHEPCNKKFFVKILGGAVSGFGFWAWVTFLFAGTGFAMAICVAIVIGGGAVAAFSDEIAAWVSKRYDCPKCGKRSWYLSE